MNLRNIATITLKELKDYFISPVAYIVIISFVAIVGLVHVSNLFVLNSAEMTRVFEVFPVLLIIFTAAVTMSSWSDERRIGTLELLTSQPLSNVDILLGKFMSNFVLIGLGLGLTLTIPASLELLGNPDLGVIFVGYLGLVFLLVIYILIGQIISLQTGSQISAFILTSLLLLTLYFISDRNFLAFIPRDFWGIFQAIGFSSHYQSLLRGVIDSKDLIYFISVIVIASLVLWRSFINVRQIGK